MSEPEEKQIEETSNERKSKKREKREKRRSFSKAPGVMSGYNRCVHSGAMVKSTPSVAAIRAEIDKKNQQTVDLLLQVLTPEQRAAFEALLAEHRDSKPKGKRKAK